MIKLSEQQGRAAKEIEHWFCGQQDRTFVLHGYAGTGKSTIAKVLTQQLPGLNERQSLFMAYTGKAAMVLRQKGCDASTIHQALYAPDEEGNKELCDLTQCMLNESDAAKKQDLRILVARKRNEMGDLKFQINPTEEMKDARLIIIDECSMLNQKILYDIFSSTKAKILLLGDPAQLPPVKANQLDLPANFLLTEIHRQAAESPLLRIATQVREGKGLSICDIKNEHGHIVVSDHIATDEWPAMDQIICGMNRTRHSGNRRMRRVLHGMPDAPITGEKIVVLRNDHKLGIYNGMTGMLSGKISFDGPSMFADIETDDGKIIKNLNFYAKAFGEEGLIDTISRDFVLADFGYILTCHKSQGSEWDNIGVMLEGRFARDPQWIYTALTRARKSCKVLMR